MALVVSHTALAMRKSATHMLHVVFDLVSNGMIENIDAAAGGLKKSVSIAASTIWIMRRTIVLAKALKRMAYTIINFRAASYWRVLLITSMAPPSTHRCEAERWCPSSTRSSACSLFVLS